MQLSMTLKDTTNKGFQYMIGQEGGLEIGAQAWFHTPFNDPFRTSDLKSATFERQDDGGLQITFKTLNSTYVFESTP